MSPMLYKLFRNIGHKVCFMRVVIIFLLALLPLFGWAQRSTENIIIITTDGLRWQEVFKGMDSAIANNPRFNQEDSTYIYNEYWHGSEEERRKKLMPFLWSQ